MTRQVVVALTVAAAVGATSCSTTPGTESAPVVPLDVDRDRTTTVPAQRAVPPAAPTSAAPTTEPHDEAGAIGSEPEASMAELREQLDEALERYGRALTGLVGRPTAASDPGDPLRLAWDRAVTPTTAFSAEMLASIRQRFEQDRIIIGPGPSGLAYRHHALVVTEPIDATVSFTWCGHSPGIGYDADSGAEVDDAVAHAHGTGMASRFEDGWRIDSLDEFDVTVLPAGAPDPCPAEVAAERQR